MHVSVNRILEKKGRTVWSVPSHAPVSQAVKIMVEQNIGAVLVLDGERIAGIYSERDFARNGHEALNQPVSQVLTKRVICIGPDSGADECLALMTNEHIRHLPVVVDGKLVGLVSIGDVVKAVIEAKGVLIDHLERYIMGSLA